MTNNTEQSQKPKGLVQALNEAFYGSSEPPRPSWHDRVDWTIVLVVSLICMTALAITAMVVP